MLWHRAIGTEQINRPNYTKRPYLYELPVLDQDLSDYMAYLVNNELAVSLSLSDMRAYVRHQSGKNDPLPYPEYPELLAKRLPWFMKHLCERTDMVETGTRLRVGITTDLRDTVMPYLEACNFPMAVVDWFDSREATHRWSSKYDAMRMPTLQESKRVLHIDISFLIGTRRSQRPIPMFASVREMWGNEYLASGDKLLYQRGESQAIKMPRVEEESRYEAYKKPSDHLIWSVISSIYGRPVDRLLDFWLNVDPFYHVPGGIIGISRKLLEDDGEWVKLNRMLELVNDEAVFGVYAYYQGWRQSDIANINEAFPWSGYPYRLDPYCTFRFCTCEEQMSSDLFLGMHY